MREGLKIFFLVFFVFLIYSNTLSSPFIFDDEYNILKNPYIRLYDLSFEGIKRAAFESPSSNRPVANIIFALNHYFHRYNVAGYHLVNILIHILTGIFLYLFIKITLTLPSLKSRYYAPVSIATFTALIWLVHPIQIQSVTYIVQRMNSMASMFYVLSFLLYVKGRLSEKKRKRWLLFLGCIITWFLALGSKEIAITLPFFILVYEWYFFQDLDAAWLRRHTIHLAGVFILASIAIFFYLGFQPLDRILSVYDSRNFTLTQRVLTESRVVLFYISLLIFPHPSRLNLDHDFPISYSLTDPTTTLISVIAILMLIGLVFYMAKREPLISFSLLWFLGNLAIESTVFGLEIIFEHRMYLPSMFVIFIGVLFVHQYVRYTKINRMGWAVLLTIVVVFSIWSHTRNFTWASEIRIWKDCVKKAPAKARPRYNLEVALARHANPEDAVKHYRNALQLMPNSAGAYYNLGNALSKIGKYSEAIAQLKMALLLSPAYPDSNTKLGDVYINQNDYQGAIKHYKQALKVRPYNAEAYYGLGLVMMHQAKYDEAVKQFENAIQIKPEFSEAYNNLGLLLSTQKRFKEAIPFFLKAINFDPFNKNARDNLNNAKRLIK